MRRRRSWCGSEPALEGSPGDEGDLVAPVKRAPRDVPAGVCELLLERLSSREREIAVASAVAHEHPQSATAAVERPPGGGRDSRAGEQNEPGEGPRRAESEVAGE